MAVFNFSKSCQVQSSGVSVGFDWVTTKSTMKNILNDLKSHQYDPKMKAIVVKASDCLKCTIQNLSKFGKVFCEKECFNSGKSYLHEPAISGCSIVKDSESMWSNFRKRRSIVKIERFLRRGEFY